MIRFIGGEKLIRELMDTLKWLGDHDASPDQGPGSKAHRVKADRVREIGRKLHAAGWTFEEMQRLSYVSKKFTRFGPSLCNIYWDGIGEWRA